MGSFVVVVPDVLFELFVELFFTLKGCSLDKILIERPPKPLHFSVGLGTIGPGVAVFDPHFLEHSFKWVLLLSLGVFRSKFRAIIRQDLLKLDVVVHLQDIHHS